MRIALVSREVYPLHGGGIATHVTALARTLSEFAEVKLFTTAAHETAYASLRADGDPRLPPPEVELVFVREPGGEDGNFSGWLHEWSARAHAALARAYRGGWPDVVEFCDYNGEGAVTIQAKRTADPALADTTVCLRLCGSAEMCDVLNGHLEDSIERRVVYALERYALAFADRLLLGGGDVRGSYERFYAPLELAPFGDAGELPIHWVSPPIAEPPPPRPLRLLYAGRLERRKGVLELVSALQSLPVGDWRLTLAGGDTDTGPLGTSMRAMIELAAAGDERIELLGPFDRERFPELIAAHHALVVPSRWECGPNVALEALSCNRPVVGTPVGGLLETAGWLSAATGARGLAARLAGLVERPELVLDAIGREQPLTRFRELVDEREIRASYVAMARVGGKGEVGGGRTPPATAPRVGRAPLVSVVVPYFRAHEHVRDTIDSILAQSHDPVEVIVVNDGSFTEEDELLAELAQRPAVRVVTQVNRGLGAARNLGIATSAGEYVLPLDADDMIEEGFLERCVAALEADPAIAFVSAWLRMTEPDGTPREGTGGVIPLLGNAVEVIEEHNLAASPVSLFRRSVFDRHSFNEELASYEDWQLYRELRRAGLIGHVVPEPLIRYRVRPDSMTRTVADRHDERIRGEMRAHLRAAELGWTPGAVTDAAITAPRGPQAAGGVPGELEALRAANEQLASSAQAVHGSAAATRLVGEPTDPTAPHLPGITVAVSFEPIAHHAGHSGHGQLAARLGDRVRVRTVQARLPRRLPRRLADWLVSRSGSAWYGEISLARELALARIGRHGGAQLAHILYGEDGYRYLGALRRVPGRRRDMRLVCTYHQPPAMLEQVLGRPGSLADLDGIIALSREQAAYLGTLTDPARVHFAPAGVDTGFFAPASNGDRRPPDGGLRCLFVGSWLRDAVTLCGVVDEVRRQRDGARFTAICGPELQAQLAGHPVIETRCGISDEELRQEYRDADVFALPLLDATANNALLEAMACGVPVVATDVGGVRDYAGGCADLVGVGDVEAMAGAILGLADDPDRRAQRAAAVRERALLYDWEHVIERVLTVYDAVLAGA